MDALLSAIAMFDGQAGLAAELGLRQQNVWNWLNRSGEVPENECPNIERATGGKVSCEKLRPDIRWHRVSDKAWPWHPKGRPLIDLTRQQPAVASG